MRLTIVTMCCLAVGSTAFAADLFDSFFSNKTLRIDYFHTGTKGQEYFSLDEAIEEGVWPGSRTNLVDTLNLGEYMARVFDAQTNALIFSRGFSSIFNEWQTTDEALRSLFRTFSESVRIPFPKRKIQFTIARRDKRMDFHELWTITIDPADPMQIRRAKSSYSYKVNKIMGDGAPSNKVDIVILGDGYAKSDMKKFSSDAKRFNEAMFKTHPFREKANQFNVWTIDVESPEGGISIPDKNVWKSSVLGLQYSTFGTPRYVLTTHNKTLRDIASLAPYDFICIIFNDARYGGGGIFNLYATSYASEQTRDQEWQMEYVYVHEFGHSFAGLGDEYYGSTVAYNDFYSPGVEPWEPNVTALLDKNNVKWSEMMRVGTPLPTAWDKARYDSLEAERGKLDRLAPDYYAKREPILKLQKEILKSGKFVGAVGAFEGSGYASKGLYRPSVDCRMFTLGLNDFDPVCSRAIQRVIDFYSK